MNKQIAVITGASSGFGLLTTLELAKKDYLVIATMRNLEKTRKLIISSYSTQLTAKHKNSTIRCNRSKLFT
ncbi:SDR family NAD(P)-dependent oxidoreductase [Bacillus paranthracis]